MARGKPARRLVVKVPRHGAQRIGVKFSLAVEHLVRKEFPVKSAKQPPRVRYQHNDDSPLAQSIEAASEWNSLLASARAQRGPQWDVGTQQFHVDVGSTLYYDPTPLLDVLKQQRPQEEDHLQHHPPPPQPMIQHPQEFRHESPRIQRNPSGSAMQPNYAYGSPRHPQHQPAPFNPIPPGHFYADPRTVGAMGNMSPDIRRRVGRMGPEDGFITLHGP